MVCQHSSEIEGVEELAVSFTQYCSIPLESLALSSMVIFSISVFEAPPSRISSGKDGAVRSTVKVGMFCIPEPFAAKSKASNSQSE